MGLYRSKTYNFKSRDCEKIDDFDIPFAIKEYLQNTSGQILKALRVREWRDWDREDLTEDNEVNVTRRKLVKENLMKSDPCLFAGDQGKAIAKSALCQPQYILQTLIPREKICGHRRRNHDLRAVVILWCFGSIAGAKALTVYNNYLDRDTELSHFVHDGSSTSRQNVYAVGCKGKGFSLSTSFLAQECQSLIEEYHRTAQLQGRPPNDIFRNLLGMSEKPVGVGFNVGGRMCRGAFSKGLHPVLKVKVEYIRALSVDDFKRENPLMKDKVQSDDDESDDDDAEQPSDSAFEKKLTATYKRRALQKLALRDQRHSSPTDPSLEQPLVREDDVCIHIIGLPASLLAEEAFSAAYGIFGQPKAWTIQLHGSEATQMEIFQTKQKEALFYLHDQLVPIGSPLTRLSINYSGDLHLSSDRTEIKRRGPLFDQYSADLGRALGIAIYTYPELATMILESLLVGNNLNYKILPQSDAHGEQYRAAFTGACRLVFPDKFSEGGDKGVYPFANRTEDESLIRELGFIPIPLPDWKMTILEEAGAYISVKEYAEKLLLEAAELPGAQLAGLNCLNRCLRRLIPELKHDVSVRQYPYSVPRVLYHGKRFFLAHPDARGEGACRECPVGACLCWVGPALLAAMERYDAEISQSRIFQIYDKERGLTETGTERQALSEDSNVKVELEPVDLGDSDLWAGCGYEELPFHNPDPRSAAPSTPTPKASSSQALRYTATQSSARKKKPTQSPGNPRQLSESGNSPQSLDEDLQAAIEQVNSIEANLEALRVEAVQASAALTQVKAKAIAKGTDRDDIVDGVTRKRRRH